MSPAQFLHVAVGVARDGVMHGTQMMHSELMSKNVLLVANPSSWLYCFGETK